MKQYRVKTQAKIHVKTSTKNTQTRTKQQWNSEFFWNCSARRRKYEPQLVWFFICFVLNIFEWFFFCIFRLDWILVHWVTKKNQKQKLCVQWFGREQKKTGADLLSEIGGDVLWKA